MARFFALLRYMLFQSLIVFVSHFFWKAIVVTPSQWKQRIALDPNSHRYQNLRRVLTTLTLYAAHNCWHDPSRHFECSTAWGAKSGNDR